MAKISRRRFSKADQKQRRLQRKATVPRPPKIPDAVLEQHYRRNSGRFMIGLSVIFALLLLLIVLVAVDVSGCSSLSDPEDIVACSPYSLLEFLINGGPPPAETDSDPAETDSDSDPTETDSDSDPTETNPDSTETDPNSTETDPDSTKTGSESEPAVAP